MKKCIDCNKGLTKKNRSRHQPDTRCLKCFDGFSGRVDDFFKGKIDSTKLAKGKTHE